MSSADELTELRKKYVEVLERNKLLEQIIRTVQLAIGPVTSEKEILKYIEARSKRQEEASCSSPG